MTGIDLDRLLKLRVLVARFGEMDLAKWWNTKQLGRLGAATISRGFPRTHRFAQARSVFSIAAHRCAEIFDPPAGCVTLWRLPESIEEEFDARWELWLDNAGDWLPFFQQVEELKGSDLTQILRAFDVADDRALEAYARLRRSAEERAVPISEPFSNKNSDVALLALGFACGEQGAPAVPYARRADT